MKLMGGVSVGKKGFNPYN